MENATTGLNLSDDYLHVVSLALTFACVHALKPTVAHVSVAITSTIPVPSTARSATTDSPGFLEHAAGWTCHHRRDNDWRDK